jgi:hypothetical protein
MGRLAGRHPRACHRKNGRAQSRRHEQVGSRCNTEMGAWLKEHGLADVVAQERYRLLLILQNISLRCGAEISIGAGVACGGIRRSGSLPERLTSTPQIQIAKAKAANFIAAMNRARHTHFYFCRHFQPRDAASKLV